MMVTHNGKEKNHHGKNVGLTKLKMKTKKTMEAMELKKLECRVK